LVPWDAFSSLGNSVCLLFAIGHLTAGTLFELDAIAAAYGGGVSAAGGVGKVTGSVIGALVILSLTSGMNLMGIDISPQYIRNILCVALYL